MTYWSHSWTCPTEDGHPSHDDSRCPAGTIRLSATMIPECGLRALAHCPSGSCGEIGYRFAGHHQAVAPGLLRGVERAIGCLDHDSGIRRSFNSRTTSHGANTNRDDTRWNVGGMEDAGPVNSTMDAFADAYAARRVSVRQKDRE